MMKSTQLFQILRQIKDKDKIESEDFEKIRVMIDQYDEERSCRPQKNISSSQLSIDQFIENDKQTEMKMLKQSCNQSIEGKNFKELQCYGSHNNIIIINETKSYQKNSHKQRLSTFFDGQSDKQYKIRNRKQYFSYNDHQKESKNPNTMQGKTKGKIRLMFLLYSWLLQYILWLVVLSRRNEQNSYYNHMKKKVEKSSLIVEYKEQIKNHEQQMEKTQQQQFMDKQESGEQDRSPQYKSKKSKTMFFQKGERHKQLTVQSQLEDQHKQNFKKFTMITQTSAVLKKMLINGKQGLRYRKNFQKEYLNYKSKNKKMIGKTFQKYTVNQTITESNTHFEMINNHEALENLINVQLRVLETIHKRMLEFITNLNLIQNNRLQLYQMLLEKMFNIQDLNCIQMMDDELLVYEFEQQKQIYEKQKFNYRIENKVKKELQRWFLNGTSCFMNVDENSSNFKIIRNIYEGNDNEYLILLRNGSKCFIMNFDHWNLTDQLQFQEFSDQEMKEYLLELMEYLFQNQFVIDMFNRVVFEYDQIQKQSAVELQDSLIEFNFQMIEYSKKWTVLMIKKLINKGFNYKCYINNSKDETIYDNELMIKIKHMSQISKSESKVQNVIDLDDYQIMVQGNNEQHKSDVSWELFQQAIDWCAIQINNILNHFCNMIYDYQMIKDYDCLILVYDMNFRFIYSNRVIEQYIIQAYSLDPDNYLLNYTKVAEIIEDIINAKTNKKYIQLYERGVDIQISYRQNSNADFSQIHVQFSKRITYILSNPETSMLSQLDQIVREDRSPKLICSFESFNFDIFSLQSDQSQIDFVYSILMRFGFFNYMKINMSKFSNFIETLKYYYNKNQLVFHNFQHGIAVFHTCYLFSKQLDKYLNEFDRSCLIFSGLCHDVGHTGFNNNFEMKSKSKLSLRYNVDSILEQHHISMTFRILSQEQNNIFIDCQQDYSKIRKRLINNILATDMANHFQILKQFETLLSEIKGEPMNEEQTMLITGYFTHCADFSGVIKPFEQAQKWSLRVNTEFSNQYIQEGVLKIEQTPFMKDLHIQSILSKGENGFIQFIVLPLYQKINLFLDGEFKFLEDQLNYNKDQWSKKIEQ